jgi:pathogenesis-related protein 1
MAGSRWTIAWGLFLAAGCSAGDNGNGTGAGDSGLNGGFGNGGASNVPATCNHNGVVDPGEQCDGNALGAATCGSVTMGAQPQGNLRCTNTCTFDRSGCTSGGNGGNTGVGGNMMGAGGMTGAAGSGGTANGGGGTPAGSGGTINGGGGTPAGGTANGGGGTASGGSGGSSSGDGETGRMVGMTAATNDVRHGVNTPNPLPDMTWSPAIAAVAQAYANTLASQGCNLVHSHTPGYGENLAEFGGQAATAQQVVQLWASEGACYTYGPITANDSCPCVPASGGACGHYTQLVWRGTTQIGCGVATCPGKEVWVCNYQPPGNYIGQKPY